MDHNNQSGVSPSNLEPMVLEDGRGGAFAGSANTSKATRIMANFGGGANAKKVSTLFIIFAHVSIKERKEGPGFF